MKTDSTTSIPNPTPLLFMLMAMALLVWPDTVNFTGMVAIAALVVLVASVWLVKSPSAAIVALIWASAVPRLFINVMGLKAHPEHIIGGLLIFVVPFLWKRRTQPVRWIWPDYCVIAYIGLIFFSSLFMSMDPRQTVRWAMQQVLAILPYFWLRVLITDRERFRWAFHVLLVAGVVTSAYAIVSLYSYLLFGSSFGVDLEQYGDMPATYGLQYEPNILGAYGAALAVMMLVMYLQKRERKFLYGYAFVGFVSMAVSLSRAALGATFIVLVITLYFASRRRLLNTKVILNVTAATLVAFVLVAPVILPHYAQRFSSIDVADPTADPNTLTRAVQTFSAFDEVAKHPVFGGGVSSFQLAFDWQSLGTGWQEQGWIGNTELRVLHDTGAVGLLVFLAFIVGLVYQAWKLLKREFSAELSALLFASVVYCITFQATEGTLLAFPWVQLGLIGCAVSIMERENDPRSGPAEIAST